MPKRVIDTPTDLELTAKGEAALRWIADKPDHYLGDYGGAYAWQLGAHLRDRGLLKERRHYQDSANADARAASQVLRALRRRGLVTCSTPGGEAFQAVSWWITEAGKARVEGLAP